MKTVLLIISLLISNLIYSQDGSDIKYLEPNEISENLIGKFVHIDFYNRSFRAKKIDTIELKINNKITKFIEVRNDNGFNNWFSRQSLISEDKTLQIEKFQVRNIEKDKIFVTAFIKKLNDKNLENIEKQNLIINRNKIAEILINAKQEEETKTFYYNAISCTCAQWSELNKKTEKEYFYLEPINENLTDASKLWNGNNLPLIVRVTGNIISENDYPEYFTEKHLEKSGEKGKIFRYTKIEILKQ